MDYKITTDLHCHSVASTHAFSTIKEICESANENGLSLVALTNHVPPMEDAPHIAHFRALSDIPCNIEGVTVLKGAESSVIDSHGKVDLHFSLLKRLEIVIASFHEHVYIPNTQDEYIEALLNLIENSYVDIIGHMGRINFELNSNKIEKVVKKAKEYKKLVEINESTLRNSEKHRENCLKIASICKQYECPIVVNSDSHICYQVGQYPMATELLKSIEMPLKNIMNLSKEKIIKHLEDKKKSKVE